MKIDIKLFAVCLILLGCFVAPAAASMFRCPDCYSGSWPDCEWECDSGESCCDDECCGGDCCFDLCDPECCSDDDCDSDENCGICESGSCMPGTLTAITTEAELNACTGEGGTQVETDPYTPPTNGCGPEGGVPGIPNNPAGCTDPDTSFLEACNAHDACYGTCGSGKDNCDGDFDDDMADVCSGAIFDQDCYNDCNISRNIYHMAVMGAGDSAYANGQIAGCTCCEED